MTPCPVASRSPFVIRVIDPKDAPTAIAEAMLLELDPCPVALHIFQDWSEALREASRPEHRDSEELLSSYAGAVGKALDRHLAACAFCKEPTMNPEPVGECGCKLERTEAGLHMIDCPLHAAAPELLEACNQLVAAM